MSKPNFEAIRLPLALQIDSASAYTDITRKINNGVPSMLFACFGNVSDRKHCNVGATVPSFSSFPEVKEMWRQIRNLRFGDYAIRIANATTQLRSATSEAEDKRKAEMRVQNHGRDVSKATWRPEQAEVRRNVIAMMRQQVQPSYEWNEIGQSFSGETLKMRSMCYACRCTFPYHQVIQLSKEQDNADLVNETGNASMQGHKCAESAASLLCGNMKVIAA